MRHLRLLAVVAIGASTVAIGPATSATGASKRTSGVLQFNAFFVGKWQEVPCSAGTPSSIGCYKVATNGIVSGLGDATQSVTIFNFGPTASCQHQTFSTDVIAVAGKGEIDLSPRDASPTDARRL